MQPAWTPLYFMMYHNYPLVMHNKPTKHFIAMGETNLANDVVVVVVTVLTETVTIAVRPEVSPVPKSGVMKVVAGDPAELSCDVTQGSPRPEITWKREVGGRGEIISLLPQHAQTLMLIQLKSITELRAELITSNPLSVSTIRFW